MYEHERQVQIHKNEGFTVLSNGFIRDKNLSNRALGLLTFMLSLPPNWDYSIAGLTKVRKEGYEEIALFCFILVGGILGFLVFNANPAKIFMGDTGSLALGATLGTLAILSRHELLLILIGIVFVIETLTCLIQRYYYKLTKKRLFPMTPIHHTFEKLGWNEKDIVKLFWIVGLIGSMLSIIYGVWLWKKEIDILLLIAIITISIFGVIMVYSSSYVWAEYKFNDPFKFVKNQSLFLIIGIILMIIVSKIDYKIYYEKSNLLFIIAIILLILVAIPGIGTVRNGSRSWFGIGSFGIQPSEAAKLSLIIFTSKYLCNNNKNLKNIK